MEELQTEVALVEKLQIEVDPVEELQMEALPVEELQTAGPVEHNQLDPVVLQTTQEFRLLVYHTLHVQAQDCLPVPNQEPKPQAAPATSAVLHP